MDKSKDYSRFMDVLKAAYFRPETPSFGSSYRRAEHTAAFQGWLTPTRKKAKSLLLKAARKDQLA